MLPNLLLIVLTLIAAPSALFSASSSSSEKLCCQQRIDWDYTKKSRCTNCHIRYFDEVYGEYPDDLPRRLQPRYISDYLSEIIKTLDFKNDPRALTLLKRMLDKIPAKYASESAQFFLYAAENLNMSGDCLQLLQEHGADINAKDSNGRSAKIADLIRNNTLSYFLPRSSAPSKEVTPEPTASVIVLPREGHAAEIVRDDTDNYTVRMFNRNGSLIDSKYYYSKNTVFELPECKHLMVTRIDESETDEESSNDSETETNMVNNDDIITETPQPQSDHFTLDEIGGASGIPGLWPEPGSVVEAYFGPYQPPKPIDVQKAVPQVQVLKKRLNKRQRTQSSLLTKEQKRVSSSGRHN